MLEGRLGDIEALILTHGHEDHIGAVPYFIKTVGRVPIMGTRFTLALVRSKLEEHRLKDVELIEIAPTERHQVGPFEAEFIRVTHSIPDCVAVALRSPAGTVRPHRRLQVRSRADRRRPDRRRRARRAWATRACCC